MLKENLIFFGKYNCTRSLKISVLIDWASKWRYYCAQISSFAFWCAAASAPGLAGKDSRGVVAGG